MITNLILLIFTNLISLRTCTIFPYVYPRLKLEAKTPDVVGEALFLTPHLEEGNISQAQNLSRVPFTEKLGFKSYSGFFTVNKTFRSNLYFWYFPPFSKTDESPVVLWLQGGPGASSLFGLFTEIGPLVAKSGGFGLRRYHWALHYHLLFIDNPVGTGFSFTEQKTGYCRNEECIAENLFNALLQFFTLFPNLKSNELYIAGESYAGKYTVSLAMYIHRKNSETNDVQVNLQGLALGNAYCDPVNQMDYGNYLYQHGLLDNDQRKVFLHVQNKIAEKIKQKNWAQADLLMDKLMDGGLTNISFFKMYTGFNYFYNFMKTEDDEDISIFSKLIHNDKVRRMIHVGGRPFNSGEEVQMYLSYDLLKSVAPSIEELLLNYRIMFYNGQLDIIVAYPLTVSFLRKLKYPSAFEYKHGSRLIWFVDEEIAGYVKKAGNLVEVLVRNAGHMVPHDKPKWALNMIMRFIQGTF
ncbi:Venom serine carboxypeptidase [Papilio machaon]|uniref:Carboxypeptidase n=1 Tax=Papilio machaon TaxID=76193 RepID=A0A194RSA4_PAPMA|nr:venom serine carboxypeptidase [Papilio machaon]KPJ20357.1 Venom serine carboxypeptidase [Papilio machaon]